MRILVISGGSLERDFAFAYFHHEKWDGVIAADSGLRICDAAGIVPDYIVGDFDSLGAQAADTKRAARAETLLRTYERRGVPIRRFKPEKDLTDTQIAAELALELVAGAQAAQETPLQIHVLGGTGTRLDHVLGNLQVMEMVLRRGAQMILADPYVRVRMHAEGFSIPRTQQWGRYVSLIPWAGDVKGLTLKGFQYLLEDAVLATGQSLGISNEITGERGEVTFREGLLLAVESSDQAKNRAR